jgi:hypothetical protein
LEEIRCFLVLSVLGSPAAVAEGERSPENTLMQHTVIAVAFVATIFTTSALAGTDTNRAQEAPQQARLYPRNAEALLAVVNGVTVLEFDTDRPVRQARLLVNGRVVDSTGAGTNAAGLKVAAIPGITNIAVHLQVPSMGWLLHGAYPSPVRADLLEEKRYGPGKKLVLTNWTEVFGIRQTVGTNVIYTMSVEAK